MLMNGSSSRLTTLAVATLAIVACAKKENYAADTTAAASTTRADTSAMAAGAPAPSGNWTDPNIVALLDEANMADSSAGAVAATKGTASAVRDFARRMMRDHHQLRAQGQGLAKKLKITPAAPPDDPVTPAAPEEMDTLNSIARGKDIDNSYIDAAVDVQKAV